MFWAHLTDFALLFSFRNIHKYILHIPGKSPLSKGLSGFCISGYVVILSLYLRPA